MPPKSTFLFLISTIFVAGCKQAKIPETPNTTAATTNWIYQVDSLLMPFWMTPEAIGAPPGNFPNYRDNRGKVLDYGNYDFSLVPEGLETFLVEQPDSLRRTFLRMLSRQVYAYCTAYHMTGSETYLENARTGVDYLLREGGYDTGSPFSYWQDGRGMPATFQRTTQDLAYALTGPAMYYYLTRDPKILASIRKVQEFVLTEYYDKSQVKENTKLVMWVKEDFEADRATDKKLLAVLDQLNAYLVFLTPIVPDSLYSSFTRYVHDLAHSLKDNFYAPEFNMFWADLNRKKIDEPPTDFGHSIKSFWMLYLAGRITGDLQLTSFAREHAEELLRTAYINEDGSWANMYQDSNLNISNIKFWWSFAELDQMAATLSFADTSLYTKYLKQTYRYWDQKIVDTTFGGTHLMLDENGNPVNIGMKANHWKNGFHSLEHALIGYLSTMQYEGKEVPLYYAFKKGHMPGKDKIRPYYYIGEIMTIEDAGFNSSMFEGYQKTEVVFRNIR